MRLVLAAHVLLADQHFRLPSIRAINANPGRNLFLALLLAVLAIAVARLADFVGGVESG